MKRTVAFLMTFALFFGTLVMAPVSAVSAEDDTLDSHLISHWDFAGYGDFALADKAPAGATSDTVELHGSATTKDGTLYIPDYANNSSVHYASVEDSSDLLRTAESRTFFIFFKTDKTFDSAKTDSMELASQNGAMRIGVGKDSKFFASTNPHSAGENWAQTNGMISSANTWMTLAISYDKNGTDFTVKTFFRAGEGEWVSGSASKTDAAQTWTEDNSDAGKTDGNALNIGRNVIKSYNSTWGGNLTIDDIRIYDKALTLAEVQSIEITNPTDVVSKGHSLTLSGEISVNFYLGAADHLAGQEVNVTIAKGEKTLLNQNVTLNSENQCTEMSGAYKFTAPIAAKEMTDTLTLTVTFGGTVLYTEDYSAKQYADTMLADADAYSAETVELVKAMLNFGGYAQQYFGYSTGVLANAGLTDVTLPEITRDTTTYAAGVAGSVTGISAVSATLKLESKTCIVFSLTLAEGANAEDYTVDGGSTEVNGNKITVTTDGICAQSLAESFTLTVSCGEETLTVSYSPMTYLMNQLENENTNLTNLLKALYAYNTAASAYVGAN